MHAYFDREAAIKRVYALRHAVGQTGKRGFNARVEFVRLAYRHDLVADITSYHLWDQGYEELGERTFDTCFEMGDSAEVIAELIREARQLGYVDNIREELGCDESFARWCSYADSQLSLVV